MTWTLDSNMPFGRYKGSKIIDLNKDYVNWLCGQDWFIGELKDLMIANKDKFKRKVLNRFYIDGDMMTRSLCDGYL